MCGPQLYGGRTLAFHARAGHARPLQGIGDAAPYNSSVGADSISARGT